ncbi:SMI1/KNR4 family protein [Hymenobacter actinosclerus]|uniref:Cell wall assembly regulator SMI1 n=1 Tax=Hymenobacter actinosclerus TaxID=82805 RepID=A0A1I0DWW9_9BACT|nr:SMI1/KNR4 family protein [Hymenobacter actinosclerus]SET37165.1 Cell wall assembly regulator SMI1 [Hymenobacter actinosclerus]
MPTFPTLITRLDALLRQYRPAYHAALRPPVSAAAVAAFEAEFDLRLPAGLRQWLDWHDGQPPELFEALVGMYSWPSLEDMAATMRINRELLADGDFAPYWWQPAWLPFLTNGSGDHLCLDPEGTFTGRPGQLIEHWHDGPERTVVFPSLSAWLAAVVQAYEAAVVGQKRLTDEQAEDLELNSPAGFPLEFRAE